jgi:outer membrane murein-binding lipoprotein Lpp
LFFWAGEVVYIQIVSIGNVIYDNGIYILPVTLATKGQSEGATVKMKRAGILLCVFISVLVLAGCGKEEKVTPLSEQATVIAASNQSSNVKQIATANQKITNQKSLDDAAQFIDSFAGLSPFADIGEIDKAWIVRKYHTQAVDVFDKSLYEKYKFDVFSKLSDIEKVTKQTINSNITMTESDNFASCDGTTRGNPLWIREAQIFGWHASGGYTSSDKTYFLEATI